MVVFRDCAEILATCVEANFYERVEGNESLEEVMEDIGLERFVCKFEITLEHIMSHEKGQELAEEVSLSLYDQIIKAGLTTVSDTLGVFIKVNPDNLNADVTMIALAR